MNRYCVVMFCVRVRWPAGRPADEERGGKRSRTHTQEMYYIAYDMDVKIIKPGPDGSVFLLPALFRF